MTQHWSQEDWNNYLLNKCPAPKVASKSTKQKHDLACLTSARLPRWRRRARNKNMTSHYSYWFVDWRSAGSQTVEYGGRVWKSIGIPYTGNIPE
jgi:hypothetical protein